MNVHLMMSKIVGYRSLTATNRHVTSPRPQQDASAVEEVVRLLRSASIELRREQIDVLTFAHEQWQHSRNGNCIAGALLVLECSYGKTNVAIGIAIMTGMKTLWVTKGAKDGIVASLSRGVQQVLNAIDCQKGRQLVDLTQPDGVKQLGEGGIALVNYKGLQKVPAALGFELVILDEADAQKKGSNNYQVLDNILGSPNETTAKLRFPMTASAFHLEIADVQRPLAFVMGDPTMVNWGLQQVLPLIPPKYEPGEHSKHTDWYFRAKLSKLPCEVCSTLMVLSYQSPVEIKMYEAYSGNSNYAHWMDRGHLDSVKDQGPPESSSSRPIVVKPAVEEWTELHLVQTTIDEAAHGTLFADTISLQQAQSIVHNYELLELAPHKAVWLVIFANSMHPNLPIVATFKLTEFGKALKRQFELAWVNGFDRKCRQTFLVDGKTSDQGRVVADFIKAVKMAQASQGQTPMPVLIGQAQVLSVGWDGLQEHVNVMIQGQLEDDPQYDIQALHRLVRTGQKQDTVYLYRIMMNTAADRRVLQNQIIRAAGWEQNRCNPRNVMELLDIPPSWEPEPQQPMLAPAQLQVGM